METETKRFETIDCDNEEKWKVEIEKQIKKDLYCCLLL